MADNEIKFQRIFESSRYSDLLQLSDGRILTDDGFSFDVHKVILASSSGYFRAMFCGMDKDKSEYRISNINGQCLSEVLRYIYINDICVTEININDLLVAADYLLVKDLYSELMKNVKKFIVDANCLKLCRTAYELNDNDMFQSCFAFTLTKFEKIIQNREDELVNLPEELLKCILRDRNLNVESERSVWQAIIYWTEASVESRLNYVPRLLSTLVIDEIDENLATEILNHDIVIKNHHIKSLRIESFNNLGSKFDLLKFFLQKYSNDCLLQSCRIPRKLNIISKYTEEYDEQGTCQIFISYDETLSFFRQITNVNFEPEYLTTVGSNLYIFEKIGTRCVKINLKTMESESMRNVNYNSHTIIGIQNCIYMIGLNSDGAYDIIEYNAAENRCAPVMCLGNFCRASAVSIGENIFFVGVALNANDMIAQMLNPVTQVCISRSPPTMFRSLFELVVYKNKIYLIGGFNAVHEVVSDVEVYNPETDEWNKLPSLPFIYAYEATIVLNEELIVYDVVSMMKENEPTSTAVRWNEIKECWERLERKSLPEKLHLFRFCVVDDVETIRHLTKQNRNSKVKMEESPFNCV